MDEVQTSIPVDGIHFNVLIGGPKQGPLVVLIHALMANLHMWDTFVPPLHAAGYRTLRYDQVGHGATSKPDPAKQYHFDDFTQLIRVLVQTATRPAIAAPASSPEEDAAPPHIHAIIGCSMGGVLALRYSTLYPASVSYAVSCDAPGLDALEAAKPLWQARVADFRANGSAALCRATVDRWFPPPCGEWIKAKALGMVQTCSFEGYAACAYAIQRYAYLDELGGVKARTMVLIGENDGSIGPREASLEARDRIEGAEFVCMEGVGHLPPMHRPEDFNRIMFEFLGKA